MMLGEYECDEGMAYFLKYGKNKPINRNKRYAPPEFDWERLNEPDKYWCWQGTRIPQWLL